MAKLGLSGCLRNAKVPGETWVSGLLRGGQNDPLGAGRNSVD